MSMECHGGWTVNEQELIRGGRAAGRRNAALIWGGARELDEGRDRGFRNHTNWSQ